MDVTLNATVLDITGLRALGGSPLSLPPLILKQSCPILWEQQLRCDLLRLKSAAKLRGCTPQTIINLVKRGRIKPVILDGMKFYRVSDLTERRKAGRPRKDYKKA